MSENAFQEKIKHVVEEGIEIGRYRSMMVKTLDITRNREP